MAVNKVEFGDQVVMDITDSTVSPEKLLSGETAYDKSGAKITGSLVTKDITVTPKRDTGENIATITIDDTDHDIYALSEEEVADFLAGDQEVEGNPVTLKTLIGGNAKSCSVDLLPIQDLHGYDSPWVGGAGKNMIDLNINTSVNSGSIVFDTPITETVTISAKKNDVVISEAVWIIDILMSDNTHIYIGDTGYITPFPQTIIATPSKSIVKLTYRNYGITSGSYDIQMEKGSTATTFAPYSNICPISGRTEVSIKRTGINQWDEDWETGTINANTGEPTADNIRVRSKNFTRVNPNTEYYALPNVQVFGYDKNYSYIGIAYSGITGGTFTISNNCHYIKFRTPNTYGGTYNNDLGVNYPSTDTAYHSYQGLTVTVQLGQTVYGATLDVKNGKLLINKVILDMGSINWTMALLNRWQSDSISNIKNPPYPTNKPNIISEKYKALPMSELNADSVTIGIGVFVNRLYVRNGDTENEPTGNVCYELATPIEITLTAEQISLLKGINVISTDGDNVNLTWQNIPDIEKLIGNTIEGTLTAGSTSLTLQSDKITEDSTLDIYTDKYGVNPTDITVTNGQAVLTFESQSTDLKVKVKVM